MNTFYFNQSLNQTPDSPGEVKKWTVSRSLCFQWISVHDNRKKCHSPSNTVSRLKEIKKRISLEFNLPPSFPSYRCTFWTELRSVTKAWPCLHGTSLPVPELTERLWAKRHLPGALLQSYTYFLIIHNQLRKSPATVPMNERKI